MLKECLLEIVNSKLDLGDRRKSIINTYVERYDEDTLFNILGSTLGLIADDISISFYPGVGFRCTNDVSKVGRLPMCNTFQNILNKKYKESFNNQ